MNLKILSVNALCAVVLPTMAETTAYWGGSQAEVAKDVYYWIDTANWKNDYAPKDGDNADLSFLPGSTQNCAYLERVYLPTVNTNNFGTLTGVVGRDLEWTQNYRMDAFPFMAILSLKDASGYLGWLNLCNLQNLWLNPSPAHVGNVRVKDVIEVTVEKSGTEGSIDTLTGGNMVYKLGEGALKIGRMTEGTSFHVRGGTINFAGRDSDEETVLQGALAKAAFHVDASADGTVEVDGSGKVTRWSDVRSGWPVFAKRGGRNLDENYNLPTVYENFQNGRNVIDFGVFGNETAVKNASTNVAALHFATDSAPFKFTNVRDAFFVEADSTERCSGESPLLASGIDAKVLKRDATGKIITTGTSHTSGNTQITNVVDIHAGEFVVDGDVVDVVNYVFQGTELKVLEYKPRETAAYVPMGGFASEYGCRFGGIRVGEALIFTNVLTLAERQAVRRYLMARWKPQTVRSDVDRLDIASTADPSVDVPENETLSVHEVKVADTAFVKTGEGTLRVGNIAGATSISVEAGALDFVNAYVPSDSPSPAVNPYRHYDASDASSVTYTTDHGTNNVTAWQDASRDAAKVAVPLYTTLYKETLSLPHWMPNVLNGKAVMDFGKWSSTNKDDPAAQAKERALSAAMTFDNPTPAQAQAGTMREIFYVYRRTASTHQVILLSNHSDSTRFHNLGDAFGIMFYPHHSYNYMFRPSQAASSVMGGLWTLDGTVIDPFNVSATQTEGFHVYHATFSSKMVASVFGTDRDGQLLVGGLQLAEFIAYSRELTAQERVDTEAYLMRKWLNKNHPADGKDRLPTMTFAPDVTARVGTDYDVVVPSVSGNSETFVKAGTGTASIERTDLANLKNVTVENGTLSLVIHSDTPAFHFDASDLSTMSYYVEGGVTNVTAWQDVRKNGLVATTNFIHHTKVCPTLKTVTFPDGTARQVMDFGSLNGTTSGSFDMSQSFANIREAHNVFSDANGAAYAFVFTDNSYYNYHRYGNQISRIDYDQTKIVGEGVIKADRETVSMDYIPIGFHLLSFVPTDNTHVGTIARDRSSNSGGCQIGEMIGFSEALTEERRAYFEQRMLAKWGTVAGVGMPLWTNRFDTITVRQGAEFRPIDDLAPDFILYATAWAGGGTIHAPTFLIPPEGLVTAGDTGVCGTLTLDGTVSAGDGVTLAFDIDGLNKTSDRLVVTTPLTISGAVTVKINFLSVPRPATGDYVLVSAPNGLECDLSQWKIESSTTSKSPLTLARSGNTIVLRMRKPGISVFFR